MKNKMRFIGIISVVIIIAALSVVIWMYVASDREDGGLDVSVFRALPYLSGIAVSDQDKEEGVVVCDKARVFDGYRLFNSGEQSKALLIDVEGRVRHEWQYPLSGSWHHMELSKDCGLLAIYENNSLIKLDRDSNLLWIFDGMVHHDVCEDSDGRVYVLLRRKEPRPAYNPDKPVSVDYVVILSADGRKVGEIPLLDVLENSEFSRYLEKAKGVDSENLEDILHANSVEVFDGSLADKSPKLYKKGNILLSFRNIDLIGIYDPEINELVWGWGPGELELQHQPTLAPNGNILVFDNGTKKERSRVLEVDPATNGIVWRYGEDPKEHFFTDYRGGAQRLPNGNTLIAVAGKGTAFEIAPDREVVWRYVNPYKIEDDGKTKRGLFYRMACVTTACQ